MHGEADRKWSICKFKLHGKKGLYTYMYVVQILYTVIENFFTPGTAANIRGRINFIIRLRDMRVY